MPRVHMNFLVKIQIPNSLHGSVDTKTGPVVQVKTFCYFDQYGIEIQARSTSGDGSKSWIIISRRSNRYVEEWWPDPDNSPESCELANQSYKRWKTTRDIIKHWGESCVTAANTIESDEQPFRRFYPNRQEEVE